MIEHMGYSDPEAQRAYQREWIARRRSEWFASHPCIDCGSTTDLQLDHVDPRVKVSHRIWSWRESRRAVELAKCVPRCRPCHVAKTTKNGENSHVGERNGMSRLRDEDIREVYRLYKAGGLTMRQVAARFDVSVSLVSDVCNGKRWKHLRLGS